MENHLIYAVIEAINTLTWTVSVCASVHPSITDVTHDTVSFPRFELRTGYIDSMCAPRIFRSMELALSISVTLTHQHKRKTATAPVCGTLVRPLTTIGDPTQYLG